MIVICFRSADDVAKTNAKAIRGQARKILTSYCHDSYCFTTAPARNDFSKSQVAIYCAGFPCTPYSALHAFSHLLNDPEAQQLYQVIANGKAMQPAVTWLLREH